MKNCRTSGPRSCRIIRFCFKGVLIGFGFNFKGMLMGIGDLLAQTVVERKHFKDIEAARTMRFVAIGFILVVSIIETKAHGSLTFKKPYGCTERSL